MSEFDKYKNTYKDEVDKSVAFIGQEQDFFTQAKVRHILDLSRRYKGDTTAMKILDMGCGVGSTIKFLQPSFQHIAGIDVSAGSIETASERFPEATFQVSSGTAIPFEENSFDLVFAICVMHHVPPAQWPDVMLEMKRVAKPNGLIAIFEHNPYNPLTQRAVSNCEFDKDAVLLSMKTTRKLFQQANIPLLEHKYILFFPFQGALFPLLEKGLTWFPLGAQYYVLGQKSSL